MFLVLGGLTDWVTALLDRFHYLAPFTVLMLCGVGLPLPEEVTLIGSGILLHQGKVEFLRITLVCSAAILLGDSIPYWLGRRYGLSALKSRFVARILHPERFAALEKRFAEHGNWVVFTFRFMPGVRIPGYFLAGSLGMGYVRFLVLDTLGVALSVPISIWLGKLFGDSIEEFRHKVQGFHHILAFLALTLVMVMILRTWRRKREAARAAARAAAEARRVAENDLQG